MPLDSLCNLVKNAQHEKNIQVSVVSDPQTGSSSESTIGRVPLALQPFSGTQKERLGVVRRFPIPLRTAEYPSVPEKDPSRS